MVPLFLLEVASHIHIDIIHIQKRDIKLSMSA